MTQNPILLSRIGAELLKIASPGNPALSGSERLNSWAFFIINNTSNHSGVDNRMYPAVDLPGNFYSKEIHIKKLAKPHIEMTKLLREQTAESIASIFSNLGNTLLAPAWLITEIKSIRAEVNSAKVDNAGLLSSLIQERRQSLIEFYSEGIDVLEKNFSLFSTLLYTDMGEVTKKICSDATSQELAKFVPSSPALRLQIRFSDKLRNAFPVDSVTKIGIWGIAYTQDKNQYNYPVVTPRLTKNSLFKDPLYLIKNESDMALLVRCVILSRILKLSGLNNSSSVRKDFNKNESYFLRSTAFKENQKKPIPSDSSLINFISNNSSAGQAWAELQEFIEGKFQIAITFTEFEKIFNTAKTEIDKLAPIKEEWKDTLLPILWSATGLSRLTYVKPQKNKK